METTMENLFKKSRIIVFILSFILMSAAIVLAQPQNTLRGQVKDKNGDLVTKARVVLENSDGTVSETETDKEGMYVFKTVKSGTYKLTIEMTGFAPFVQESIDVGGETQVREVNATLEIMVYENITVGGDKTLSVDPNDNVSGVTLRGDDLNFLPDDPDDLASVLGILSGTTGPGGTEFLVDGFNNFGGRLPNRRQIAEIKINQNPFTAEYDQIGFGRVSIRLQPTSNEFHGEGEYYFSDESLNSRNPFSSNKPSYRQGTFYGAIGGPVIKDKLSFYASAARERYENNAVINAIVLNQQNEPTTVTRGIVTPSRELFSTFQLNYKATTNTDLVFNYQYLPEESELQGIGGFSLESRGYTLKDVSHIYRLLGTTVLNPKTVYQYRVQFTDNKNETTDALTAPAVNVLDSFIAGGADLGNSNTKTKRFEVQNHVTRTIGFNTLRFGGLFRSAKIRDVTPLGFNGTYTFEGGDAPLLNAAGEVVIGTDGMPIITQISSIERYRRTLVFLGLGLTPEQVRQRGGGATQFSIATGSPLTEISQYDFGVYGQFDWRIKPTFNIGLGLRYENQSNISSDVNFAPRLSFAWAPGPSDASNPKTIIRGGFGVFYTRVPLGVTFLARQLDGTRRQNFISDDPTILNYYPQLPPVNLLTVSPQDSSVRELSSDLRSVYAYQSALSIERKLAKDTTASLTYINARYLHLLRSRNINAPLPGTFNPDDDDDGVRPFPNRGNIYVFESSGNYKQNQLIFNINSRINPKLFIYSNYTFNMANSDTNGSSIFPSNSYDLTDEYGRASNDVRHRFSVGATINAPFGVTLSPFVTARSGIPFNIFIGRDINGDTIFTERPSLATNPNAPNVISTRYGLFNLRPLPGEEIIPLNFIEGPAFFVTNLRATKTIPFGRMKDVGNGKKEQPYKLRLFVSVQNLFNQNNPANPIGNLSSPLFGFSTAASTEAGSANQNNNRKVSLSVNVSF